MVVDSEPNSLKEALFLVRSGHTVPGNYQETLIRTIFRCESGPDQDGENSYPALSSKHGNHGMQVLLREFIRRQTYDGYKDILSMLSISEEEESAESAESATAD